MTSEILPAYARVYEHALDPVLVVDALRLSDLTRKDTDPPEADRSARPAKLVSCAARD